jgi:hypothetical protein
MDRQGERCTCCPHGGRREANRGQGILQVDGWEENLGQWKTNAGTIDGLSSTCILPPHNGRYSADHWRQYFGMQAGRELVLCLQTTYRCQNQKKNALETEARKFVAAVSHSRCWVVGHQHVVNVSMTATEKGKLVGTDSLMKVVHKGTYGGNVHESRFHMG